MWSGDCSGAFGDISTLDDGMTSHRDGDRRVGDHYALNFCISYSSFFRPARMLFQSLGRIEMASVLIE